MPNPFFFTQHNFFPLLYRRGETTDQSLLSATWQRGKSEGVIEKVSWPRGAVSVACLSGGRHWWTVEQRAPHTHTHTCQVITGGWNASVVSLRRWCGVVLLFAGLYQYITAYNNMLWGEYSWRRGQPVCNCSSTSPSSPLTLSCCAMLPLKRIMVSLKLGSLNCGKL